MVKMALCVVMVIGQSVQSIYRYEMEINYLYILKKIIDLREGMIKLNINYYIVKINIYI